MSDSDRYERVVYDMSRVYLDAQWWTIPELQRLIELLKLREERLNNALEQSMKLDKYNET